MPASAKVFFLEADYYQNKTQHRKIAIGKGEIISSDGIITRVAVSEPSIIDLQVLNEKQIFVRAKKLGNSTFLAWEKDKPNPTRFDVSVSPDIEYLKKQLAELDKTIIVEYIPPGNSLAPEASTGQQPTTQGSQGGGQAGSAVGAASGALNPTQATGQSPSQDVGKIILNGEVENAEIIARSLQIAGSYVGDQGIKIISQPGGQVVDGLGGNYNINSNSDFQGGQPGGGSATSFGARDPIRFTSNRYANLSRGVIATTQMGSVISFLTVKDPPQVSVAIRFYEIQRNVSRNLGFNSVLGGSSLQGVTQVGGNGISQLVGGIGSIANLSMFMLGESGMGSEFEFTHGSVAGGSIVTQTIGQGVTGAIFNPDNGIGILIQALQERGEIKTLAETNLVIANGEPASFLAGGEVPIVRSVFTAGGASQDVSYEPFGIKFNLLPTVTSQNKIFLQLIPEIRDIDSNLSNFVVPPGSTSVRPPVFRTRRTQTQVELESGQAFAISGLLREDNSRNLRKVPGIGDIPILGTLFRSKSFNKGESELLIVVSPKIVRPTSPDKIAKLSIPEVPYKEFDQLAPLKPYIKYGDEKGPEPTKPLDAGKYFAPENKELKSFDYEYPENENLKSNFIEQKDLAKENELNSLNNNNKKRKKFFSKIKQPKLRVKSYNHDKILKEQEGLKVSLQNEIENYKKAKEAMKLARVGKYNSRY